MSRGIFLKWLSLLLLAGFFVTLYWIAFYTQEHSDHDLLNILIGVESTAFVSMIRHWFKNTDTDKDK